MSLNVEDILSRLDRSEVIYKPRKKPHFSNELDEKKWYAKIIELCYTGDVNHYGLRIPPSLVFATHFATIQDRILGSNEPLIVRDVDFVLHTMLETSMNESKWMLVLKARGLGFSTVFGGIIPFYFSFMNAGCKINITHADQSRLDELYDTIALPMWHGLDPKIRPDGLQDKKGKGLTLSVNTIEDGIPVSKPTRIRFKPTHHSKIAASGFSGGGNRFAFIDEYFLNKQAEAVASSLIAASTDKKTMKLVGMVVAGGTCENTVSGDQLKEFKKGWIKADDSHIWNKIFLPYWLGYGVHLNKGHSDIEGAKEKHDRELEQYKRGGNEDKLIAFLKDNPEKESDVFDLATTNRFEPNVEQLIKVQYSDVLKMKDNIWSPTFLKNINNNIEAIPINKSNVTILEHPKPHVRYWIVVDNIGKGKEFGATDGSKYSAYVIKGVDPNDKNWKPVAHCYCRPQNLEDVWFETFNMALYYGKFSNFVGIAVEANSNMEFFAVYFRKLGYYHLILNRRDLSGKGFIDVNKIGQDRTSELIRYQYSWANSHLSKYITSITSIPLLEDMMTDAEENVDALDSFLQLSWALPYDYDLPVVPKKPKVKMVFFNENGKTGYKIETEIVGNGTSGMGQIIRAGSVIPFGYNATPEQIIK